MTQSENVKDYLLPGETTYDQAISRALAANNCAHFPAGQYTVNSSIVVQNGQGLRGDGSAVTTIICNDPEAPVVLIGSQIYSFEVIGLELSHINPAPGGDGIAMGQSDIDWIDSGIIEDVIAHNNYAGFNLGKAFYAEVISCEAIANLSDGWRFTTTGVAVTPPGATGGPLQWYLYSCESNSNKGNGYAFAVTGTAYGPPCAGSSVGTLSGCITYANGIDGVSFAGTEEHPLNSARLYGGFFGNDARNGIFLNTFARDHVISPDFVEQSGANNIFISGHNANTNVSVKQCSAAKWDGLKSYGDNTQITGGNFVNNGLSPGAYAGIHIAGGSATVTGVTSRNWNSTFQSYGLWADVDDVIHSGCRFPDPNTLSKASGKINGSIGNLVQVGNSVSGIWFTS